MKYRSPGIAGQRGGNLLAEPGFASAVIDWQKQHGRHGLPWQNTRDAYRIWLSEIMLQQTQVAAVIPYYQRFLQTFPDVAALARAPQEQVMAHWSGLGYYSRARNLHKCAQKIMDQHGGVFPTDPAALAALPGIGPSTAAAIAAFSAGVRAAILDGNVKRVLCRVFGIEGYPGSRAVEDLLWQRAEALLPQRDIEPYTQGLMDLGATVCTRSKPSCPSCPLAGRCVALDTGRVAQLPARKPSKAVPERQVGMLVITDGERVLLEQRPQTGIWGGLLSLPEVAAEDRPLSESQLLEAVRGFCLPASWEQLPPFSHGFTHFRLRVQPYRVHAARRLERVGEQALVWYLRRDIGDAPLPAPVKKLLLDLFSQDGLFRVQAA